MPTEERLLTATGRYRRHTLAINVERIANQLGITIERTPLDGPSGVLLRHRDRFLIIVNSREARVQQRFTLAHELGHVVLGHEGHLFRHDPSDCSDLCRFQERQANRFAENLLIPEDLLYAFLEQTEVLVVQELASAFEVGFKVAYWRLVHAGLPLHDIVF